MSQMICTRFRAAHARCGRRYPPVPRVSRSIPVTRSAAHHTVSSTGFYRPIRAFLQSPFTLQRASAMVMADG